MKILRSIVAVLVGMVAASGTVGVSENVVMPNFYALPEGVDKSDMEQLRAAVADMPPRAFALILAGWTAGAFVGGAVAALISGRRRCLHASFVGGWILLASIIMLVLLPHPNWMRILGVLVPIPASLIAGKLVSMLLPTPPSLATTS